VLYFLFDINKAMNSAHRQSLVSPGCRFLEAALHLVAEEGSPKARLTTILGEKEKSKTPPVVRKTLLKN